MGNPEGTVFGAKKQHETLIDNSTSNMTFGYKNETRERDTRSTSSQFVWLYFVHILNGTLLEKQE